MNNLSTGKETITITKEEYDDLVKRDEFLECLEVSGVDNWEFYGEAKRLSREMDSQVKEWEDNAEREEIK